MQPQSHAKIDDGDNPSAQIAYSGNVIRSMTDGRKFAHHDHLLDQSCVDPEDTVSQIKGSHQ